MKHKIYLSGPIAGLSYNETMGWRDFFAAEVAKFSPDIFCASPMRGKEFLRDIKSFKPNGYDHPLSTGKGIMTRDHWDCMTSDLIVVNLLGAERVSIGTVMEMAWGHAYRKPIILIMEDKGNVHEHALLMETVGLRVQTLDEAVQIVRALLPTN